MAVYKQLFSAPLVCRSTTQRDAEFLVVDYDRKGAGTQPYMKFGKNDRSPQLVKITNTHASEAMCVQIFPPLPKIAWDKPFNNLWMTMENDWRLEIDGEVVPWRLRTGIKEPRFKMLVLDAGVTKEIQVVAKTVEPGPYGLTIVSWCKGQTVADEACVSMQKYGTPFRRGVNGITSLNNDAKFFAEFCEQCVNVTDAALQLESGIGEISVTPREQHIFAVLDGVVEAVSRSPSPGLSTPLTVLTPITFTNTKSSTPSPKQKQDPVLVPLPDLTAAQLQGITTSTFVSPTVSHMVTATPNKENRKRNRRSGFLLRRGWLKVAEKEDDHAMQPSTSKLEDHDVDLEDNFLDYKKPTTNTFQLPPGFR
ncbi:unnamed protein product, partial [Mesorhabditis belari]|uniref:Uncharacterized protein n=1 Tax=Mesorhabditis belari TaxID=2138241 RepID=A0AAF3F1J4_9BILA